MVLTLIPFAIICLIVAGIAGSCSFRPNGPSTGEIPQYNAQVAVASQARQVSFPLRLPATPEGWTTNSGGTEHVANSDGGIAVNVGYITDRTVYLRLSQSNLPADMLLQLSTNGGRTVTGEQVTGGITWAEFSGEGSDTVWVAQLPTSSVSITSGGSPAEFTKLAEAFAAAAPLPTT